MFWLSLNDLSFNFFGGTVQDMLNNDGWPSNNSFVGRSFRHNSLVSIHQSMSVTIVHWNDHSSANFLISLCQSNIIVSPDLLAFISLLACIICRTKEPALLFSFIDFFQRCPHIHRIADVLITENQK